MATSEVIRLLRACEAGDREGLDRLISLLYTKLGRVARAQLRREVQCPLDTCGLVHEAYLRLAGSGSVSAESRSHFLSIAARAMRRVLIDLARRREADKRGGGMPFVTLHTGTLRVDAGAREEELLALDEALERLSGRSPRQGRVVECRVFAGMTVVETAEALGISPATVKRDWSLARAWLNRELSR